MLNCQSVGALILLLGLEEDLCRQVESHLGTRAKSILARLWTLPLKRSNAVTRLGSYSYQGEYPKAIRLQFAQEDHQLRQTFLHEIAHYLDHQTRPNKRVYRTPHAVSWQQWFRIIGGEPGDATSTAISTLYQRRLKVVARCERCGVLLKRLRALSRGHNYLHRNCGGRLVQLG